MTDKTREVLGALDVIIHKLELVLDIIPLEQAKKIQEQSLKHGESLDRIENILLSILEELKKGNK